jgi:hypothetical protein
MDTTLNWPELLRHPGARDHMVQVYRDEEFLVDAVAQYIGTGLAGGEAAIIIARPEHRERFVRAIERDGAFYPAALKLLDAETTLAKFMVNGMPEWNAFHALIGGTIAEMRLQYPTVRAYGEMVDILWQRGEKPAAIQLEKFWNEIGRLQTFSLLCAYALDPLHGDTYAGLESICRCHTHLIPARDYAELNEAVFEASLKVLDPQLAQMLLTLAANHRPHTEMPLGQAALFWLSQNMPRTAERVLDEMRAQLSV